MVPNRLAAGIFAVALTVFGVHCIHAQPYPSRPIRIATTQAGGGSDFLARLVGQGITGPLGQPVVIDNRGGGATISGEIVARAEPDGYTLLAAAGTLWIGSLLRKTSYDPLKDFSPITLAISTPNVLVVHPSVANSVRELIALARAKPGVLNYGSGATGASSHIAGELFKHMAQVDIVRVPYKGSGLAVNAVMSNEVQLMFPNGNLVVSYVKAGRLKALAVTSAEPFSALPELPTVAAAGLPGYEAELYTGLLAPARTPAAIIKRLNYEIVRYLRTPRVKDSLMRSGGSEVVASTPGQFSAKIRSEMVRVGNLIKETGIRAE
ncbi:MAG: tripartite tricarboxylate transporter substrate binding protein [Betaproteobacteria bacterium]|nr:tripartite tricarboxylate transporter substrate binding protein [Betaproteobacteria bacterium]